LDIPVNPGNSGGPAYFLDESLNSKLIGLAYAYEPSRDWVLRQEESGYNIVLDKEKLERSNDSVFVLKIQKGGYLLEPSNSSLSRIVLVRDALEEVLAEIQAEYVKSRRP
jgi:hypothetical protein